MNPTHSPRLAELLAQLADTLEQTDLCPVRAVPGTDAAGSVAGVVSTTDEGPTATPSQCNRGLR
ncbi:hypothetical protein KAM369_27810 [Aeromonas caviae]|nr:hypothetical protein KAM369_27810 [Aeromonas caviae]GJB52364.1 hypothetical protein KAM372_38250 [Aeromonas caviae]